MGYIVRKTKNGEIEIEYPGGNIDEVIELAGKLEQMGFKKKPESLSALTPEEKKILTDRDRYKLDAGEEDLSDEEKLEFLEKMPTLSRLTEEIASRDSFGFDIPSLQREYLGRTFLPDKKKKNESNIYQRFYERVVRAKQKISDTYEGRWRTDWRRLPNAPKYKIFWFEKSEEKAEEVEIEEKNLQDG
jgi:hypothetical protein